MKNLQKCYDQMQNIYGSKAATAIYGAGCKQNPIALVFMNPTKRNIASSLDWKGLKAQWLGTKQIWSFLTKCGLFDQSLNTEIQSKKPSDWTEDFCETVYNEVTAKNMWITNLAKCTQEDARPLKDEVFLKYKDLLLQELQIIKPRVILLFGNQVSSLVLNQTITVSSCRQKLFTINLENSQYPTYAVFYPVGNGRFNQDKAIEDIREILKNY